MEGGEVSAPLNARNYPFRNHPFKNRRWTARPQLFQLLQSCQRHSKLKDLLMHAQTTVQLIRDNT